MLKEAGLVLDHAEGTRRIYELDPSGLVLLRAYLERFWNTGLAAFKARVEEQEQP